MMRLAPLRLLAIAALGVLATQARADEPAAVNAKQVAGLFMQSCLQFAGDKEGLRAWARKTGLIELPANVQKLFLYGLPGVVYDASNQAGKFVLVSEDGGSCVTVAERANGQAVASNLEQDMHDAQIGFKVTADRDDAEEKSLRHREYLATLGPREWRLLISTVKDAAGGQAMLSVNPN